MCVTKDQMLQSTLYRLTAVKPLFNAARKVKAASFFYRKLLVRPFGEVHLLRFIHWSKFPNKNTHVTLN